MKQPDSHPLEFATLLCERPEPGVLVVKLNRPDCANALNTQMSRDVLALFAAILLQPGAIRCVVLTGVGQRAFCAGGDLKERDGMSDQAWLEQHVVFEQAFRAVMECPVPVIAAVNGAAYGGGCELALACDFIYAGESARFAQTETRLGITPGAGGTQNLPRAVGAARAKELIYSAIAFDAHQAFAWGMVNKVVPDQELAAETLATARAIAANAPVAVRQAKVAITNGLEVDRRTGLMIEIAAYNQTVPTADRREGIRAALERRPPKFTGS
ncbi:MAG TPA: enoyl-CoA hydratase-related protein [Steroidobacteraceae bacterium]|nr:enoyl-CoA hydratase-related protein [Steroidobacteraceae bacterium]